MSSSSTLYGLLETSHWSDALIGLECTNGALCRWPCAHLVSILLHLTRDDFYVFNMIEKQILIARAVMEDQSFIYTMLVTVPSSSRVAYVEHDDHMHVVFNSWPSNTSNAQGVY